MITDSSAGIAHMNHRRYSEGESGQNISHASPLGKDMRRILVGGLMRILLSWESLQRVQEVSASQSRRESTAFLKASDNLLLLL